MLVNNGLIQHFTFHPGLESTLAKLLRMKISFQPFLVHVQLLVYEQMQFPRGPNFLHEQRYKVIARKLSCILCDWEQNIKHQ